MKFERCFQTDILEKQVSKKKKKKARKCLCFTCAWSKFGGGLSYDEKSLDGKDDFGEDKANC